MTLKDRAIILVVLVLALSGNWLIWSSVPGKVLGSLVIVALVGLWYRMARRSGRL